MQVRIRFVDNRTHSVLGEIALQPEQLLMARARLLLVPYNVRGLGELVDAVFIDVDQDQVLCVEEAVQSIYHRCPIRVFKITDEPWEKVPKHVQPLPKIVELPQPPVPSWT